MISWATEAGYLRLWASVRAWNLASRRVLEKLNFHYTGEVTVNSVRGGSLLTVLHLGDHLANLGADS